MSNRFTIGSDGPEVRTPAAVAYVVALELRTWLDVRKMQLGIHHRDLLVDVEEWVREVEAAAAVYRACLVSAGAASGGHLDDAERCQPDDRDVSFGWPTTGEAADLLGITPRHVGRLIGRSLVGRKVGRDWRIDPASIEHVRRMRGAA